MRRVDKLQRWLPNINGGINTSQTCRSFSDSQCCHSENLPAEFWPALFPRPSLGEMWRHQHRETGCLDEIWKKNKKKRHQNTYEGMKSQSFFLSWNSSQLSSQGQRNWKTNAEIQATRTLTPLLRFSLLQMSRALTALLASFLSSSIFFFQLLSVAASFAAQPVDTCWWAHRAESIGYRKISEASETSKVSTTRKRTVTECDSQHWKSYE